MRFEDALLIGSPMEQSGRRISDTSRLRNPVFVGKTSYSAHGGNIPNQRQPEVPALFAHEICQPQQVLAQQDLQSSLILVI